MDRDKAKVELKETISQLFKEGEIGLNREGCIGDNTIGLIAEAALSVLLATEDSFQYMKDEELIK